MEWKQRWPNFEPEEVLSPEGMGQFRNGNLLIQPNALDFLQELRALTATPLIVNTGFHLHRGYRSPNENEAVGGAVYSRHMQGIAFDISWKHSVEELAEACKEVGFSYTKLYSTWVHADIGMRL